MCVRACVHALSRCCCSGFSGTKESTINRLETFAADGFVAMSFDMAEHGERMVDADSTTFVTRVRSNLRKFFWEILAQSAGEFTVVIDWAVETLSVEPHVAVGGQSAGVCSRCCACQSFPQTS